MNVTGRVNIAPGHVLVALGFVVGGMVFAGGEVAHAATGFVASHRTRLYMLPEARVAVGAFHPDVVTQLTNLLVPGEG